MKYLFLSLLIIVALASCDKEPCIETDLIGEYRLAEMLMDPGDGSGTFQPVNSDKTIEFHNDGTVTSNGDLCFMTIEANSPTSGTYSITDSTISITGCSDLAFELENDDLIIHYPCIEGCSAKFRRQ